VSGAGPRQGTWVEVGLAILDGGSPLSGISLADAERRLGALPGSAAADFPDGTGSWHAAVAAWLASLAVPRRQPGQARDPLDTLRDLRRAADDAAAARRAMRDWAAVQPAAAAVLEEARGLLEGELTAALEDLGLSAAEAVVMARVLVREFGCGPGHPAVPPGDDAGFELLLALVARTVRDELLAAVEVAVDLPGAPGSTVSVVTRDLPAPGSRDALGAEVGEAVRKHLPQAGGAQSSAAPDQPDG
jgi:hypothetical protein